jgi:hypothetical protein
VIIATRKAGVNQQDGWLLRNLKMTDQNFTVFVTGNVCIVGYQIGRQEKKCLINRIRCSYFEAVPKP